MVSISPLSISSLQLRGFGGSVCRQAPEVEDHRCKERRRYTCYTQNLWSTDRPLNQR